MLAAALLGGSLSARAGRSCEGHAPLAVTVERAMALAEEAAARHSMVFARLSRSALGGAVQVIR